jgi:hypothetical protein
MSLIEKPASEEKSRLLFTINTKEFYEKFISRKLIT